ncbi:Na+/H+-dicarboxylate symporter [Polymorphobacter multimanifer]|uniref:Na+/H+-dicarboxylate symporter n=1 Tax=Polymorphobacter multimanifer TaxID=1070431 RepID=A0A841L551_9SPHN|nr:dicarboxylate/amino acid:cation symporter [Polymorphobacter multimanifer]MBB6227396.1 Na+/H+-dicarboxylate symporter [Polymorphobacter multimanifer]
MTRLFRQWLAVPLWQRILAALVLGALAGLALGAQAESLRWLGDLFIRLIRMLIVPLVFITLVAGITGMEAPARLASIGLKAMTLYMATTFGAVLIGLALALAIRPGIGLDIGTATAVVTAAPVALGERMMAIVPENVIAAFAAGDVLAVIFFAVLLGTAMVLAGPAAAPLTRAFTAGSAVMLRLTGIVMEFAPFGVFALVATVTGSEGLAAFTGMLKLGLVVFLGGALHMLLLQGALVRFVARMPIPAFLKGARTPQLMAFSTSSSAATLPVSLEAAQEQLGVPAPIASVVLPLGATINMDGTGLYVAAVAVFAAQVFGIPLSLADYGLIALTTMLVSIGTASVPSASLFLMAAVLDVIGVSTGARHRLRAALRPAAGHVAHRRQRHRRSRHRHRRHPLGG